MANKHKHRAPEVITSGELKTRVERALQEGRFQHALDLGKQLYKHDPSPEKRDLLLDIDLRRGQQLRKQGYVRDALQVLDRALELGNTEPRWLDRIAEELAACGEARRALTLISYATGSEGFNRILARAADSALQRGATAKQLLPESLHEQFDLVLGAFNLLEAGKDEETREVLQGIGLQSPFLEWKVLLRGLLAYYQNDDL